MFFKTIPLSARLALDLVMVLLLVLGLGARLSGTATHEWAGMVFLGLVAVHVWINRLWLANLFTGRYPPRRVATLIVNLALFILVLLLAWGGLLNSGSLLGFLELEGGLSYRQVHVFASYWLLVVAGTHVGLHWTLIAAWTRKNVIKPHCPALGKAAIRLFWLMVAAAGMWASLDRDMGAKLFRGFGFDYWDPERPVTLFYLSMLCIMAMYALVARLLVRSLERIPSKSMTRGDLVK